jgi:hypothetical protein
MGDILVGVLLLLLTSTISEYERFDILVLYGIYISTVMRYLVSWDDDPLLGQKSCQGKSPVISIFKYYILYIINLKISHGRSKI